MVWEYEKFKGDGAIYAFCPKCGFYHNPSRQVPGTLECEIAFQYKFCPMCGEYLYNENGEAEVTWNERDISDFYAKMYESNSNN